MEALNGQRWRLSPDAVVTLVLATLPVVAAAGWLWAQQQSIEGYLQTLETRVRVVEQRERETHAALARVETKLDTLIAWLQAQKKPK